MGQVPMPGNRIQPGLQICNASLKSYFANVQYFVQLQYKANVFCIYALCINMQYMCNGLDLLMIAVRALIVSTSPRSRVQSNQSSFRFSNIFESILFFNFPSLAPRPPELCCQQDHICWSLAWHIERAL